MAVPPFPQKREAELLSWSSSFDALITDTPTRYGLTIEQAAAYATLHSDFATKYATATNPNTNSKANVERKNTAKEQLLYGPGGAWQLVNVIQAWPEINNDLRAELNIRIPDTEPTPVPVPDESPVVDVVSSVGHSIKVRVHDDTGNLRSKPAGVKGASLFFYVGDNPPSDVSAWSFALNSTKNLSDISVPAETAAGAKVWLTAFWFNSKMQSGPGATPVSIHIPGGLSVAA